ncbi:MAG: glycosyltransferase family 2 protein [Candidatus Moranbacteria bacterium]|nr:glycosyltransferase family 2 protein [Candidatus Moranbacteria bacterium]
MNEKKLVSIIVVNYKSASLMKQCILSFSKQLQKERIRYEWIVVNNSPSECLFDNKELRVCIINSSTNEGFARGCNKGAKRASGEILWFLNPDTEYKKGSIYSTLSLFQKKKDIGIVGARLVDERKRVQRWIFGETLTFWTWLENKITPCKSTELKNIKEVGWVSGASFMIKKNTFFLLGGFDEKYFMYFEDMDLCLRLFNKMELRSLYTPFLCIRHLGGKSFNNNKKKQKKWYYNSMRRYTRKHLPWWQRFFFASITRFFERYFLI